MTLGKMRDGSLHSSAMLTESSNPTIAKKASAVAAVTAPNTPWPRGVELGDAGRSRLAAAERPQHR